MPDPTQTSERAPTAAILEAVVSSAPIVLFALDMEGRFTLSKGAALDALGVREGGVVGQSALELYPESAHLLERALEGESVESPAAAGGLRWEVRLRPLRDAAGTQAGVLGIATHVTDRELARSEARELAAANAELAAVNRELESFSHSVSHDLHGPLRAIDGFSAALEQDAGHLLDENALAHLHKVRRATNRITSMLDDLLSLACVSKLDLKLERVNLSALAHEVWAELRETESSRTVSIAIEPDLHTVCDRGLMRIALRNLLSNAWKFTSGVPDPRVRFLSAHEAGDGTAFRVEDNGAGFDMAYVDRIFDPFQRLHSEHEFAGTGIGLATVQRIVHRHGGRIRARGEVGHGASFTFTL